MAAPPNTANEVTTTIVINQRIHQLFKMRCAELRCTMREKVETLITRWLDETETSPTPDRVSR